MSNRTITTDIIITIGHPGHTYEQALQVLKTFTDRHAANDYVRSVRSGQFFPAHQEIAMFTKSVSR